MREINIGLNTFEFINDPIFEREKTQFVHLQVTMFNATKITNLAQLGV